MKKFVLVVAVFALLAQMRWLHAQAGATKKQDPFTHPFANPTDDPELPRVLVIGDSISIGYTPLVRKKLQGKANVHRPKTNCRWSAFGAEKIDEWLGDGNWDVIHFNFGLWDWYGWSQEEKATPESYGRNLEIIVERMKKTDAKLIFGVTTPPCLAEEVTAKIVVPTEMAESFNVAAIKVMRKHGVAVNNLYKVIVDRREEFQRNKNDVHYNDQGRKVLANRVSAAIAKSLGIDLRNKKNPRTYEYAENVPQPTMKGLRYGDHERNVIDFWKAESDEPTPLVLVIHGGGWLGGSKELINRFVDVQKTLDAKISVAAINYRLIQRSVENDETPPVKAPLRDAARALQFIRSNAEQWNIDKQRIGAAGGSAGACSSLWLAFHDDMANPNSPDPVLRESTRLKCAAVIGAQTTLDPKQMKEWTPNSKYGAHAFGVKGGFGEFLKRRSEIEQWIEEYSPWANVSSDDPPVYLKYSAPPAIGKPQKDPTHTSNFGVKLKERCEKNSVDCELRYPGAKTAKHKAPTDFLIDMLKR